MVSNGRGGKNLSVSILGSFFGNVDVVFHSFGTYLHHRDLPWFKRIATFICEDLKMDIYVTFGYSEAAALETEVP